MINKPMTIPEVRREGLRVLLDRLGPADTIRFLQQFDPGRGDYTKERDALLKDLTLDGIWHELEERRKPA